MRAIQITEQGGPDVLTLVEVPDPTPGEGEVLVDVAAAGVNYIDTYQRDGTYSIALPYGPGLEGAGRVSALGAGVTALAVGDRIAWATTAGSYAERVAVPAARAVPVPDGVSDETAAAVLLQGMTAWVLAAQTYPVAPGDDVLLHAAAGGVGLLLTQLVTARGGRVIATVSTDDKEKLARAAGAAAVLRYGNDLAEQVRASTGGVGVAVAYDGVGATTFDASLAALRRRGMLVLFGAASGPVPPVDPQRLNAAGSVYLTRPSLFHYVATTDELRSVAGSVFETVAEGILDVRVGQRYPLADAAAAHEELQSRRTTGKLVLIP